MLICISYWILLSLGVWYYQLFSTWLDIPVLHHSICGFSTKNWIYKHENEGKVRNLSSYILDFKKVEDRHQQLLAALLCNNTNVTDRETVSIHRSKRNRQTVSNFQVVAPKYSPPQRLNTQHHDLCFITSNRLSEEDTRFFFIILRPSSSSCGIFFA